MEVKAKAEVTLASIKDVASVTRYYLLQSSSSAIPAKPTTNPPGGNWVRTEPSYTTGSTNSLYFTDLTVFSDGTFTYSDVSLSSSYEAAKVAYNKAVAAQEHIDNLEIGGRNLARGTGDTTGIHWVMQRATEANGVLTITPTTSAGYGKYIMDYLLYGENANQTFTLSFDAREIESASGYGTGAINVYMGVQSPSRIDSIMQSAYDRYGGKTLDVAGAGWNRYSVSFTFPSDITTGQASAFTDDAIISFEFGRARNTCPLEVKNCKLERGAKATDWTPAPEDVSKYTDDSVNAIEIGGNNLYAVCNQVYGYLSTSGTISSPTAAKCKTSDYIPVSEGEHYVFQAWVPSIGASQQLWIGYVFYSDTSGTRVGGRTAKYATAGEKYLAYTDITVPANAMYIRVSYRQYEDGYCKLEKGNKPTDWSPAPEDVDSRITGTNLSPFFSYTPYVVGDFWTTWPTGNGYVFTPKGDGWVRIQKDNSTGSSVVRHDIYMTRAEMVRPGSDYTMLFEFRNNNSTGDSADSNVYIVQGTNTQFWGNSIKKILEGVNSNTASTSLISDFPPGTSGIYRKRFVKTSEPSDSSHWTGSEAVYLTCLTFRCAANSTIDYEVRISLYEGECIGPYKPYNVDIAEFASVKTAANGKNKVFHQASTVIPASGELKTGDTWFVTDLGYKMRTWNGNQWVDEQFDSDAIVAGAIKTSHLDAGAVTAAKIDVDDLFAQDITATGSITTPILLSDDYNGGTGYPNTNTLGSIINLRDGKINIGGGLLKYDSTDGLSVNGTITCINGTIGGFIITANGIQHEFDTGATGNPTYRVRMQSANTVTSRALFVEKSTTQNPNPQNLFYVNYQGDLLANYITGYQLSLTDPGFQLMYIETSDGTFHAPIIRCTADGQGYLGSGNYRWKSVYCSDGAFNGSDRKIKNHLEFLTNDDKIEDFVYGLKPVMYTLKNGDSKRHHMGLYAQDVSEIAHETIGDVAAYQASVVQTNNDGEIEDGYFDESIDDSRLNWSLNYSELIAPVIAVIQKQNERIKRLEAQINGG